MTTNIFCNLLPAPTGTGPVNVGFADNPVWLTPDDFSLLRDHCLRAGSGAFKAYRTEMGTVAFEVRTERQRPYSSNLITLTPLTDHVQN